LKRLLLLLLFVCTKVCFSQDSLYVLHRLVGADINKEEKRKYFLFSDIKDSVFNYCVISHANGKYFLNVHFVNDSVTRSEITLGELNQYRVNIDKLNEYYVNKSKKDSVNKVDSGNPLYRDNGEQRKPETITLPAVMKAEAERDARLKEDQQRMNDYRQGSTLEPSNIELFNSGNKKKKKK
jgi:hypothetical protein